MGKSKTDCRTDEGIAVQLIDTIINSCRILRKMDAAGKCRFFDKHKSIIEAFKDLNDDVDVKHIIVQGIRYSGTKIDLR